ncbi:ferrochelatase [Iamia majanohamensis]|uniref:Coproporphyrin III ferrochelatase n=1 Tax=Iamia majanohamensis TaxID=467976 RepID=A0AAE9Y6P5_9ACTN|nr:ferrochelatase [Iamia majanohamensis]WCO67925.1 ferrochelatase [Iamia majanohamensis]
MTPAVGVVVMAYGTPARPEDIEGYYTHIRRGRPPEPEQLADLTRRYQALGGTSSLARRTADQVAAIAAALEERAPGRFAVALGQKHAAPFVEDGAAALAEQGVGDVVGLVLAPHFSGFSVGVYQGRLAEAVAGHGGRHAGIESWADEPAWLDFTATAVTDALADLPEATKVLFTAHSLPERVLVEDPYPRLLADSARAVARRAGLAPWAGWGLAWQSAGRTPEPWRGPDILQVLRDLADTGRADGVLVCPQGFVTDHLEVGYDLDIEARGVADEVGLAFARTRTVDADPAVMGALADRVVATADAAFGP